MLHPGGCVEIHSLPQDLPSLIVEQPALKDDDVMAGWVRVTGLPEALIELDQAGGSSGLLVDS